MVDAVDRTRTPLLALITEEALDRDYLVAASRRGAADAGGPRSRAAVVVVVAAFAMLVTVAAVQTSRNDDAADASRASLIERIEVRRTLVNDLQGDIVELRKANTDAEKALRSLGSRFTDRQARASELGALTGFEAVTGDGIRAVLDNAAFANENSAVRDSDLALLANALWSAGAEAITINGQRLSAAGAIRTSGDAIEVNGIGVAPPYTIKAIGDQRNLAANLLDSQSGLQFLALRDQYGFVFDIANEDDLRLSAAPGSLRILRSAEILRDPQLDGGGAP